MSICADVAADPVHEEMAWLNAEASRNIAPIEVTFSVFQLPMSWLNAEALENIWFIKIAEDVSHFEISALKVDLPLNPRGPEDTAVTIPQPPISVTKLVSQFGIVP